MSEYRTERVGRLIQEKIGALIVEGKIKDPRVHPFLTITRVSVSRDFAWAEVYVSHCKPQGNLGKGVAGLQSAAGFIQSQLAGQMHIRQTPRLRFHEDSSIQEGFGLIQKLEALHRAENPDGHEEG
ncbi:MAG: 30S ribosome-binding factor RbfA [Treponema sp.]|jgi:ribosome-binding factor A|nr:30S ribosome-binding factor RbfA [Treponema sp.]